MVSCFHCVHVGVLCRYDFSWSLTGTAAGVWVVVFRYALGVVLEFNFCASEGLRSFHQKQCETWWVVMGTVVGVVVLIVSPWLGSEENMVYITQLLFFKRFGLYIHLSNETVDTRGQKTQINVLVLWDISIQSHSSTVVPGWHFSVSETGPRWGPWLLQDRSDQQRYSQGEVWDMIRWDSWNYPIPNMVRKNRLGGTCFPSQDDSWKSKLGDFLGWCRFVIKFWTIGWTVWY